MLFQIIARKWIKPGMDKMIAEGNADAIAAATAAATEADTAAAAAATSATNKEWRRWLNRRAAALARGEPFSEPAPDEAGHPPTPLPDGE